MNERKNNGRGIFYGVIGVATLVVAIIGATFAYFTATAANNVITGNMATVKLALDVKKVSKADNGIGMIPMSNSMVDAAVRNASNKGICIDNNGNPVCQVYKITLTNDSSAGQFVDGYVALRGGSGAPTDYTQYPAFRDGEETQAVWPIDGLNGTGEKVGTTMRWAQVFCTEHESASDGIEIGDLATCSTGGTQILGSGSDEKLTFGTIDNQGTGVGIDGKNDGNIRWENGLMETTAEGGPQTNARAVLKPLTIAGTSYNVIGTNYIRVSNHQWTTDGGAGSYKRETDVTSALVFNHNIPAKPAADAPNQDVNKGIYYVVVWLSETGTDQTAGLKEGDAAVRPTHEGFFVGNVTFISAQGSEVSATFANHTRVPAQG